MTAVDLVHRCEVVQVGEKYGRAHDMLETCARCPQQRAKVAHHLLGLRSDISPHQLTSRRVERNLA